MIPSRWILSLVLSLASLSAYAQSADDLIERHFEASGGLEQLRSVETKRQSGSLSNMGMDLDITLYQKRPNLMRSEVVVQGEHIVTAFDGTTGWTINPMTGSTDPQRLPPAQAAQMRNDLHGPLVDYAEKGHTITYEGEAEVEGERAYQLDLTTEEGEQSTLFLAADSYLVVKHEQETVNPATGEPLTIETFLSDYRKVEGLQVPFHVRVVANGQMMQELALEEVAINPSLEDEFFAYPQE